MAIQWLADLRITGHPPCSIWELPADIADEVRMAAAIVNKPLE